MRPQKCEGGGANPGTAPPTAHLVKEGNGESTNPPTVYAVGYSPSGARRRWLLIVLVCSVCEGTHAHFATSPRGGIRRRGCGHGDYNLRTHPLLGAHPSSGAA